MQPNCAAREEGEEGDSGSGSDKEGTAAGGRGHGRVGVGERDAADWSAWRGEGQACSVRHVTHGGGEHEGRDAGGGIGRLGRPGGGGGGGGVGDGDLLDSVEVPRPVVVQDESVRKRNRKMLGALLFGTLQVGGWV